MEKWKERNDDTEYNNMKYNKQANNTSKLVRNAKRQFDRKIADNVKSESKSYYASVNSSSEGHVGIALAPPQSNNSKHMIEWNRFDIINTFE